MLENKAIHPTHALAADLRSAASFKNRALLTLVGAMLLPLVLNGYPIVFWDSGTYISAYWNVQSLVSPPPQRPIFYSLYIFAASLGRTSLPLVCLSQALLIAVLLRDLAFTHARSNLLLFALALAVAFSYLAVQCCALMPDIWSAIGFLAVYLLVAEARRATYLYAALVTLSVLFAPANGIILAAALLMLLAVSYASCRPRALNLARSGLAAGAIFSGLAFATLANEASYGIASPIASSGAFLFATLTGDGLTDAALDRICRENSNPICMKRSLYEGKDSQTLLWGGPGQGVGIFDPSNQKLLTAIDLASIAAEPGEFLKRVIARSVRTLTIFPNDLSHLYGVRYAPDGWLSGQMASFYDLRSFLRSWQESSATPFAYLKYYKFALLLGIASAAVLFVGWGLYRSQRVLTFLAYSATFVLANAVVTGGLSTAAARYNVKAMDIAVLTLLVVMIQGIQQMREKSACDSDASAC
ncbi:MAG TPA: hypothetical protein VKV77_00655 [Methylovirgula sp.]|nr:hypothetical protein [Methylovirgula sp.]